jgi:hypothetical protein
VDYAADFMAAQIDAAPDALEVLDVVFDGFRTSLAESDYRAGCPVVAVAVEADNAPALDRAAAAFTRWTESIRRRLEEDGVSPERAEEIAMLLLTSLEGAIVVARTTRDARPIDLVHRQLRAIVAAETGEGSSTR